MGAERASDRTVHPFFTSLRERAHSKAPSERAGVSPIDGDVSGRGLEAVEQPGAAQDEGRGTRRHEALASEDYEKDTSNPELSRLSFGEGQSGQTTERGSNEDAPYEVEHLTTTKSQECDGYPHKRQKTCSPQPSAVPITPVKITQTLGWEEQLIKAGFAGSSSPVQDEAASEMVEVVGTTTENTGDARPDVTTPSKRVMRLRTDGRLVSPKTRKDNTAQLPISRRGGRKPHTYTRLRIITLKYGIAGVSVHDMGQKIEDILCGKTRVVATNEAKPQSEPKLQSQPQPAKMISAQPAKTTHPFFTGKTTHLKVALLTERAQEESEDALSSRRRSTSPPLNPAKASSSWTGFGSSFTKKPKLPGTSPAPWPPKDIVHVRGIPEYSIPLYKSSLNLPQRRLKCSEPRLAAFEEVLSPLRSSIASMRDDRPMRQFHRPRRRLMTGTELQSLIRSRLSNATPSSSRTSVPDDEDELVGQAPPESVPLHPASQNLFAQLQNTMSAFDTFACEQKEWTHKYAPKTVTEILQQDQNLLLLKEWLLSLTVNSVNSSADNLKEKKAALARKLKAKRKKRKAEDELADFLVSTDSELDDADQFSDMESTTIGTGGDSDIRRLTERNITKTSAVVLSGPSGSGKTSAVYAAASELGFEIFEINSGVRRSGRDIVDKVGDMTRNHLVKRSGNSKTYVDESDAVPLDCQAEVDSGKQSTMNVFFKSKAHVAESQAKKPAKKDGKPSQLGKQPTKKQKQSLVLLEEVDVLFDEDKHFWSTVISLLLESRRPVVLTCTDETILPVHEISGLSALRVTRSPETLAVDYLLLLAANEGHLLTRNAVTDLYRAQGSDLRATIMQLNFLCQMALGDTKGGLEWLLIRSGDEGQDGKGRPLRIISEDTIMRHMPVLMPDAEDRLRTPLDADLYSLLDAHTNWDFDPEDWLDQQPPEASASSSLVSLRRLELATEALSAADVMPGSSLLEPDAVLLDPTQPSLRETELSNYPEGHPVLDTPLRTDLSELSLSVVLSLKLLARPILLDQPPRLRPATLAPLVLNQPPTLSTLSHAQSDILTSALSPLSIPPPSTVFTNSFFRPSPSLLLSTAAHTLATDIAPFVRSIVAADLVLEQDRLRLSSLLSQGGRDGKRARTTRAARAALEGGKKESTRRERWFGHEVNYKDVMSTEGSDWSRARMLELERRKEEMVQETETGGYHAEQDEEVMQV